MKETLTTIPSHQQQKFYTETHHLNGQVMIYKGTHSPNYYVRYSTVKGYITKSLRTPDLDKAKAKAFELGELILTRNLHGLSKTQTIASITDWFTKTGRYKALSTQRQKQVIRWMRIFSEYFKNKSKRSGYENCGTNQQCKITHATNPHNRENHRNCC